MKKKKKAQKSTSSLFPGFVNPVGEATDNFLHTCSTMALIKYKVFPAGSSETLARQLTVWTRAALYFSCLLARNLWRGSKFQLSNCP